MQYRSKWGDVYDYEESPETWCWRLKVGRHTLVIRADEQGRELRCGIGFDEHQPARSPLPRLQNGEECQ